ncbi:hypothetical protein ACW0FV_000411 [Vibrio parahaemolyticus]
MIYEEPEQKQKKHNKKTVHILVDYIKGNDERVAKNLINYSAGTSKERAAITEFIYANNIIHIPHEARTAPGELLDLSEAIADMQAINSSKSFSKATVQAHDSFFRYQRTFE